MRDSEEETFFYVAAKEKEKKIFRLEAFRLEDPSPSL